MSMINVAASFQQGISSVRARPNARMKTSLEVINFARCRITAALISAFQTIAKESISEIRNLISS